MNTTDIIRLKGNGGKHRSFGLRKLLASASIISMLLGGGPLPAHAESTIETTAYVKVNDGQKTTYLATGKTNTYRVHAGAYGFQLLPHDAYLVVLTPDGQTLSWDDSARPQLANGLVPHVKNIVSGGFYTQTAPEHRFTGEAPGIYHISVIVTASGADPYDPANWIVAASSPLIYQPAANAVETR